MGCFGVGPFSMLKMISLVVEVLFEKSYKAEWPHHCAGGFNVLVLV